MQLSILESAFGHVFSHKYINLKLEEFFSDLTTTVDTVRKKSHAERMENILREREPSNEKKFGEEIRKGRITF